MCRIDPCVNEPQGTRDDKNGDRAATEATYRQRGELVSREVEGLQASPLVDAEGQLGDLVVAEVEPPQVGQGVETLRDAGQVVTGEVHIWAQKRTAVMREGR